MHEFHVVTRVVKAVEAGLHDTEHARPLVVRLKVRASSHLLAHDPSALQTAFILATRGTRAEGARLEIIPVAGEAWCPGCRSDAAMAGPDAACPVCSGPLIAGPALPEVLLHELVIEE